MFFTTTEIKKNVIQNPINKPKNKKLVKKQKHNFKFLTKSKN